MRMADNNELPFSVPVDDTTGPALTTGVLVDGVFWYFGTRITTAALAWESAKKKMHEAVTIVVTALMLAGFATFVLGIAFVFRADILTSSAWWTPSIYMAGLWFAVLCAAFLYFRRVVATLDVTVLPKPVGMPEITTVPSLEVVERRQDMTKVINAETMTALADAFLLARSAGHADVTALHLFAAMLATRPAGTLFARLGLRWADVKDEIRRRMRTLESGDTVFGGEAEDILARAFLLALADGRTHIGGLEVFTAACAVDPFFEELFASKSITMEALQNASAWIRISDDLFARYRTFRSAASFKPTGNMDRAYTAIATPFLDSVTEDYTAASVTGHTTMLIGREKEVADIFRSIEGGSRSIVLVGPPGVGKSAIIEGIADRMVEERVPAVMQDKRLLKLSVPHIVSAQGGSGAQERFLYAMQQVAHAGNVILIVENLHELVGTGEGIDLSSILAGELEKGYTFVIGTATPEGYRAIESSPLRSALAKIVVNEPERNDAIAVLESRTLLIEARNKVAFTYAAVEAIVDMSIRYLHDDCLPEKAITLANEVALEVAKRNTTVQAWVTKEDVALLVGAKTGVPTTDVTKTEGARLLNIESEMHERIVGQAHAVKAVAAALRRARVELRSAKRPIANFLFLGPTGVGKTELAKTTAAVYFGDEKSMLRFDMSEYQDQASVTRLIGGNGQVGLLTEAVRKTPFALLLLDELEKAHPDILNLFLQVMDDGRLTDGTGRTVDFTNVILIATSNAGTQYIQDEVAKQTPIDQIKTALLENELRKTYRPEFLNRFDDTIVFTPLTADDVLQIAHLMIAAVTTQMKDKGITLAVTDAAVAEIAHKGFDPKFGARPLRRAIQENVENALAEFLLRGDVSRRDTLTLDVGGVITVTKAVEL